MGAISLFRNKWEHRYLVANRREMYACIRQESSKPISSLVRARKVDDITDRLACGTVVMREPIACGETSCESLVRSRLCAEMIIMIACRWDIDLSSEAGWDVMSRVSEWYL